jgi:hypothetical protein
VTETTGAVPGAERRCPWCSSVVPEAVERCPSCGAALREGATATAEDIPGVTQVDPVLGLQRQLRRPNRLVGWLADVDTEPTPTIDLATRAPAPGSTPALEGADATSIAPPSEAVRSEIRRLELEALKAELEDRVADARVAAIDAGESPAGTEPAEAPSIAPDDGPAAPEPKPPAPEGASGG